MSLPIVPEHSGILEYNALDSAVTLEIWQAISGEIANGYLDIYEQTERLLEPLMYMMTRGLRIDVDNLRRESLNVEKQIEEKQVELDERVGHPLNVNSSKQCQAYFYDELGIEPYVKTIKDRSTGKQESRITMDDKALSRLARGTAKRKGLYEAKLIQDIRGLAKLKGTFLDVKVDADDRLRCSFNPRGTKFSRLSSSKTIEGSGANLQTLPASFQKYVVADPDHLTFQMDKSGAEWVAVAYESGDPGMIRVVEEGKDAHTYTASQMYDIPEDLIKEEQSLLGHSTDPLYIEEQRKLLSVNHKTMTWPSNMSMRQAAKKAGHSLNYGLGYRTFAINAEMPEGEANRLVELYHRTYPKIREWHALIRDRLNAGDRILTNSFGRAYNFLAPRNDMLYKQAYSYLPQSTVGDLVNQAIIAIYYDEVPHVEDVEILSTVHDSIWFQFPIWNWISFARALKSCEAALDPEITAAFTGMKYRIGTETTVGLNFYEGAQVEIDTACSVEDLATSLKNAYLVCSSKGGTNG